MKKLFFVASALAALSLLAPSAGIAAGAHNQLGIYTDDAGDFTTASIVSPAFAAFTAYLVLTNPWDENAGAQLPAILGFECSITLPAGLLKQTETLAPTGVNLGAGTDYYVGFVDPVAVGVGANNPMLLDTFSFLPLNTDPMTISLGMASAPSIPGTMSMADAADLGNLISLFPSSGDLANPVFGVNTEVVANEKASWGGVKALFR